MLSIDFFRLSLPELSFLIFYFSSGSSPIYFEVCWKAPEGRTTFDLDKAKIFYLSNCGLNNYFSIPNILIQSFMDNLADARLHC